MDINTIINEIGLAIKDKTVSQYAYFKKQEDFSLSKRETYKIQSLICKYKIKDFADTLSSIVLYAISDYDECVEFIRKKGIVRYDAWGYNDNNALIILNVLDGLKTSLGASHETMQYIERKIILSWFFDSYKHLYTDLIKNILKREKNKKIINRNGLKIEENLIKDLLVFLEIIFINAEKELETSNDHLNKDSFKGYSKEELTDAFSTILFFYNEKIGFSNSDNYMISNSFIESEEIKNLFMIALKYNTLHEWEICIDYYGYKCKFKDRVFEIYDDSNIIERSIRLGFIKKSISQTNNIYNFNKSEEIEQYVEYEKQRNELLKELETIELVNTHGFRRYRVKIPEKLIEFYGDNDYFYLLNYRELCGLYGELREQFIDLFQLNEIHITDNCTFKDLIKVKAFIGLLYEIQCSLVKSSKKRKFLLESIIPYYDEKLLLVLFNALFHDKTKAEEIVELLSCNINNAKKIDIMYTPFVKLNKGFYLPICLANASNLIRNVIESSYHSKNYNINMYQREKLVDFCTNAFNENGKYEVHCNKKFKYKHKEGEIDLIAVSDDTILIIECKDPLHPTNNYELRATYDHIIKAKNQLEFAKQALSDSDFITGFLKDLGVGKKDRKIKTCIILGNRLFCGISFFGHPVRYARELDMILNTGKVYMPEGYWQVWKNSEFCYEDLDVFLGNEGVDEAFINALEEKQYHMDLYGKKLCLNSYAMNPKELYSGFDDKYILRSL